MLINSDLKKYTQKIKLIITSDILYIKNRLKIFPIKTIKTLRKMNIDDSVIIDNKTWKVEDLINDIILRYRKLVKETSTSEYEEIIKSFTHEAKQNKNYDEIYHKYQKQLSYRLKQNKDSLMICLKSIKILEKKMKESHS